jgi:hypothetical protein
LSFDEIACRASDFEGRQRREGNIFLQQHGLLSIYTSPTQARSRQRS